MRPRPLSSRRAASPPVTASPPRSPSRLRLWLRSARRLASPSTRPSRPAPPTPSTTSSTPPTPPRPAAAQLTLDLLSEVRGIFAAYTAVAAAGASVASSEVERLLYGSETGVSTAGAAGTAAPGSAASASDDDESDDVVALRPQRQRVAALMPQGRQFSDRTRAAAGMSASSSSASLSSTSLGALGSVVLGPPGDEGVSGARGTVVVLPRTGSGSEGLRAFRELRAVQERAAAENTGDAEVAAERARIMSEIVSLLGARLVQPGVGADVLRRFPRIQVGKGAEVCGSSECPICLEGLSSPILLLPCFCCGHEACLATALSFDARCPLHRIDVRKHLERDVCAAVAAFVVDSGSDELES